MDHCKIFQNVTIIDGLRDKPLLDSMLVIEGGTIVYAGNKDQGILERYSHGKIVDLRGMWIMPGMIDTHVHLSLDGSPDYFRLMIEETPQLAAIRAVRRVRKILESGFTTIRTMGDKGCIDIAVKQAVEEGEIPGPRILTSGQALTITGGHGDMFPNHVKIEGLARIVDGPDEARKAAREQLKLGADNIKLMATGGGMSPGPGTVAQLTVEEMRAAVEEASKYGKITGAHAIGAEGIKNALEAGVRTIEHGSFLDDTGIRLLLEKEAFLVPTLSAFKTLKFGEDGGVPLKTIRKVEHFQTVHMKNLKRAIKAGVKVVVGTDAGTPFNYHGESAYELECLVANGLSEMQAIRSATSIAAEALNLSNVGVIQKGCVADLVVLEANPLEDIKTLQQPEKIVAVLKDGEIVAGKLPGGRDGIDVRSGD
ncbi:MAG: amidohydrolase family protein [Deltaproteobacteria bacterium]|nr:amidohydrolase family protein [Deltaproteobacteria bacterium]MBW2015795.1 amidohydrolase family protein [Deltaproteobacteria bacterium]MBW2129221.1 amidohydrolase family protein [Deltaproteobacteria bacterium]MBW2303357.1 amidohydrolase family protein [Deltaproteobacteria bacterium]